MSNQEIIIVFVLFMILLGIAPLVYLLIDSIKETRRIDRKIKTIQKEINELINKI